MLVLKELPREEREEKSLQAAISFELLSEYSNGDCAAIANTAKVSLSCGGKVCCNEILYGMANKVDERGKV